MIHTWFPKCRCSAFIQSS